MPLSASERAQRANKCDRAWPAERAKRGSAVSEATLFQPIGFQDRLAAWMQTEQPGLDIVST